MATLPIRPDDSGPPHPATALDFGQSEPYAWRPADVKSSDVDLRAERADAVRGGSLKKAFTPQNFVVPQVVHQCRGRPSWLPSFPPRPLIRPIITPAAAIHDMDSQARVDEVDWYHEFDFGRGLKARSTAPDVAWHRQVWRFVEQQLEGVDFRDKTVLEIGAWDGYWSFLAERKGARYVLASDDLTQNWSDGRGIHLAKELLGSRIDINQSVSVYRLEALKRTFDIVMCFGVYYHLFDPLYAFAHIRHCCHDHTLVLLDGDVGRSGMHADEVRYRFDDSRLSAFLPSIPALETLLRVSYLRVQSQVCLRPGGLFQTDGGVIQRLRCLLNRPSVDRAFTVCTPFRAANELHAYEPPFGLSVYDDRYRRAAP